MGTIQFNTALFTAKKALEEKGYTNLIVPQEKPRSSGEVNFISLFLSQYNISSLGIGMYCTTNFIARNCK